MDSFNVKHWSHLSPAQVIEWKELAPNFSPNELASKGNRSLFIVKDALVALQAVRDKWGGPIIVNSAYRDPAYNKLVGGVKNSKHISGIAFDLAIDNQEMGRELERIAIECGFRGIGRYNTFIHIDKRPRRASWGKWYV